MIDMVKYALVRDDDVNFFTTPKMLEEVHQNIFEMQIPVNLSVIPYVKAGIEIKNNPYSYYNRLRYEPFIPKEFHDKKQHFAIHDNYELIEHIKSIKESVEIMQHGFSHAPHEFSSINISKLKRKIINGRKILRRALGVTPKFFSAPYDAYSPVSLLLLKKYFHGVTYGEFVLENMLSLKQLPINMIPYYLNAIRRGDVFFVNDDFLLLGHKGMSIDPFVDINKFKYNFKECFKNQKIIVIIQHHWEYFYSKYQGYVKGSINKKLFNTFMEMIQWLQGKGVKFLTVSQFYQKVQLL